MNTPLRIACRLVENAARSFGRDTRILFTDGEVRIDPVCGSSVSGESLYLALHDRPVPVGRPLVEIFAEGNCE
jgi:hypothetical protein